MEDSLQRWGRISLVSSKLFTYEKPYSICFYSSQMMANLNSLGVKPMLDTSPMIEDVRERVRELCKKNRVVTHILEIDDEMHYLEACKKFGISYGDEPSERTSDAVCRILLHIL